ncbi:uncharacterized protein UV8b_02607 [Ustilaginoidea virens]|uniref:RED-like N-terminal domain-containing protein n=1 Tax=Ustilaginoidea virens TaxID=1159556 RepID=A0A8E5MG94_USTVR|nr:uncharacterized protein UV8b_02607 [Ustilaginoidea virens]QUC18366.1 hypothetical protein UV8b_02607 [Ustilaginoidea virens]
MNNEQFRKLMLANSKSSPSESQNGPSPSPSSSRPVIGGSLGPRQRASIPMTPRSVAGTQAGFARQLAQREQSEHPSKKFRTSAPRGIKLGQGYVDRAQTRQGTLGDDREDRLRALEASYKNEEIDTDAYETLRFQIAGGDLESTHLVKGLDFKLLERVRKGEDVYSKASPKPTCESETRRDDEDDDEDDYEANVDHAFEQLETQEVHAVEKAKAEKKKGQLSTVATGRKRTRDQILAELKAARAAAAQAEPSLGNRFRKIGTTQKLGTRIERDRKGREVLIIVDADGHEKRKVRKLLPGEEEQAKNDLPMPDKNAKPLGMEVPEQYRKKQEPVAEEDEGDVNIFGDVGDDYDPLAGMQDADSDSGDEPRSEAGETGEAASADGQEACSQPRRPPEPLDGPRNYFKDSKTGLISEEASRGPAMSDPAIMAAIKKAATLRRIETEDEEEDEDDDSRRGSRDAPDAQERRRKLLQMAARDDDDLDLGFGTSRFEDEEDWEDRKLSSWGGKEDGVGGHGKQPRKRGPKKRKGDANKAADVLRVMEQRKKA